MTSFRGMLAARDPLLAELRAWIAEHDVPVLRHGFLRLHTIDMGGLMDLEVGFVTPTAHAGEGDVKPSTMPAGTRR